MYSNNADSIREALCFFMDEDRGHDIAFVQFPQYFDNITPDDIYFNSCAVINKVNDLVVFGSIDTNRMRI